MKKISWLTLLGVLLFLLGAIFLLKDKMFLPGWNFDYPVIATGYILGGLIFFFALFKDESRNWWTAIPGCLLIGLGTFIFSIRAKDMLAEQVIMISLCSIGIPFLIIALIKSDAWWALILGSLFFYPGLLFGLSSLHGFFIDLPSFCGELVLCLAAVFLNVALYPGQSGKKYAWAWFLAIFLIILGGMIWLKAFKFIKCVLPTYILLLGLYYFWQASQTRKKQKKGYEL